jgi:hypothetical protein
MSETDTQDSLPSDTPSGQDPTGHTDDTPSSTAPDPHDVKTQGAGSAAEKDPANWVTGDEPMTGPQASYLETLAHQAGEEVPEGLTKAQASDEIERLQGSGAGPAGSPAGDGAERSSTQGAGDGAERSSTQGAGDGAERSSPAGPVERPTDQWVTGDEPMTGPQASYLETLAQQAGVEPPTGLNKSEASRAIDELQAKAGRRSNEGSTPIGELDQSSSRSSG